MRVYTLSDRRSKKKIACIYGLRSEGVNDNIDYDLEDDRSILIEASSCNHQFFSELITIQLRSSHGVTANRLLFNQFASDDV